MLKWNNMKQTESHPGVVVRRAWDTTPMPDKSMTHNNGGGNLLNIYVCLYVYVSIDRKNIKK